MWKRKIVCVRFRGDLHFSTIASQYALAYQKGNHEQNQEQYEKEFCNGCGTGSNTAKSEDSCNNGYDEKRDRPA